MFSSGFKHEFETAIVHEPQVIEPLKFYCRYNFRRFSTAIVLSYAKRVILKGNVDDRVWRLDHLEISRAWALCVLVFSVRSPIFLNFCGL